MSLNQEATTILLNILSESISFAADTRLRITALEKSLKENEPALHAVYLKEIENLVKQRALELNLSALDNLRAQLLRD
jgi:hypothetical protein